MTSKPDRTTGIQAAELGSAEGTAETLAVIRASLEALNAKVAALEEADERLDTTTRRLAMDVVTLGRGLWERMRTIEASAQDPPQSARSGRESGRWTGSTPSASAMMVLVLVAVVIVGLGSFMALSRRSQPAGDAARARPAVPAAPIVVVGDTSHNAGPPAALQGGGEATEDQYGHILYGPPSSAAAAPSRSSSP